MNLSQRFIQLSDIHLCASTEGELLGVKTDESFRAVLAQLKHEDPFDFIILSGDLTQDGSPEAYQRIAKHLQAFQVPVYFIAGNHDERHSYSQVYPLPPLVDADHILLEHWQLILLNSQKEGEVWGELAQSELTRLEDQLTKHPQHHALVFMHHHPVSMNTAWLDPIGVANADDFWLLAARFPQLAAVFFGHVHMVIEGHKGKIAYYSAPSTCIQFKPKSAKFGLDHLPQGYRVVELLADGGIKTEVKRLDSYVGIFDAKAEGY